MITIEAQGGGCANAGVRYLYQRYYMDGLAAQPGVELRFRSAGDRTFHWALQRNLRGASRGWTAYARRLAGGSRLEADSVGRYVAHLQGHSRPIRFAIDSADGRRPRDPDALAWGDIYFKTNCWPGLEDHPKIKPLPNANGGLTARLLQKLAALRGYPKSIDVSFISILWPSDHGRNFHGPVEHSVRLFETLTRLRCHIHLMAIVPAEYSAELLPEHLERLRACGVPASTLKLGYDELSRTLAASRVNLLRSGKYLCVSWRMFDLLAMGACIVCDHAPYPEWPTPLVPDVHYLDGECRLSPDYQPPPPASYDHLAGRIDRVLSEPARAHSLRAHAAAYFDAHIAPERIGAYIITSLKDFRTFPYQDDVTPNLSSSCV